MGAWSIDKIIKRKLSERELNKELREWQLEDNEVNGHQDGYSGDWQTIGEIKLYDKVFNSKREALEFCHEKAEKWRFGVAVYFQDETFKPTKKYIKLMEKISMLEKQYFEVKEKAIDKIQKSKSKLISCSSCSSKINKRYIEGVNCTVCSNSMLTKTEKTKMENIKRKIYELNNLLRDEKKNKGKGKEKAPLYTIVGAWAAC